MKDTFFPINYFKSSTKLLKKFRFIKILYVSKMILRLKNTEGMIIQISHIDSLKERLAFIESDNDAAVGRFFENNDVILTRKDRAVLLLNRNKLSQLLAEIEENSSEIKIHHESLFEENELILRHDWEKFKSDFDKDIFESPTRFKK